MVMVFHEEKEGKDIMHLGKSKSKNSVSLYVLKSTYEYGFHSTKIVEKLGTTEELAKKLNGEDPIEWAKKYIEELNRKEKEEKKEIKATYSTSRKISRNENRTFNGGYMFLDPVLNELGIHTICRNIKKRHHLDFNFDDILCKLIYIRLINPSSTLSYHDSASLFLEQPDFTPRHVEKALRVLSEEADYIEQQLFENIRKTYGHHLTYLYYDTTICLYDSYARQSADHVIPMEIYYDADMMPLGYKINPDHLSSQPNSDIEEELIRNFDITRVISQSDGGISAAGSDTFKDWNIPNTHVTSMPSSMLDPIQKKEANNPTGWNCSDLPGTFNLKELRLEQEIQNPSRFYWKEMNQNDGQRVILCYSMSDALRARTIKELYILHNPNVLPAITNQEKTWSKDVIAFVTNLHDENPVRIVRNGLFRNQVHQNFRMLAMEFPAVSSSLSESEMINAHFITCYCALCVYCAFMKDLDLYDHAPHIQEELSKINFMKVAQEGYVPLYTPNTFTDHLHERIGYRTDFEIISTKQISKIMRNSKRKSYIEKEEETEN